MDNKTLARKFSEGATSGEGSHMYIDGNTIYSYGYHFPIARRMPDGKFLFNNEGYSNTTSRHKNYVKNELPSNFISPSTSEGIRNGVAVAPYVKPKRVPKTEIEYNVQGNYGHGWEDVTAEEKYSEARKRLKDYNDNEPNAHRIITRRIPNPEFVKQQEVKNLHDMEKCVGLTSSTLHDEGKHASSLYQEYKERLKTSPPEDVSCWLEDIESSRQKGFISGGESAHLKELADKEAEKEGKFTPALGMSLSPPARSSVRRSSGRSGRRGSV